MVEPDTLKCRPPYVDSLTGGTASWFLIVHPREYRDDNQGRQSPYLISCLHPRADCCVRQC